MAINNSIKINDEFITLGQFLKVINLISSGGEAKNFLINNEVLVNNKKEIKRGRKLYKNNLIVINNKTYTIC